MIRPAKCRNKIKKKPTVYNPTRTKDHHLTGCTQYLQMAQRSDKAALGKVELQVIAVSGTQMSDESMEVKVILKDTVLDDSRQHKVNGITRYCV